MKRLFLLSSLAALCAGNATMAAPPRDPGLQMIAIDVEGSGGTLFVTPEGKSLLIDTGNPPNPQAVGKDTADRLVDTIHSFGVTKIDYLITTHYHSDHVGGFPAFLEKMPVGTVIDHGENRQPDPPPGAPPSPGRGVAPQWVRDGEPVQAHSVHSRLHCPNSRFVPVFGSNDWLGID